MNFLIVSLTFLGMTSGAVVYTNTPFAYANQPFAYANQPLAYANQPLAYATPVTPELAAAGDKLKCNVKALSESACRLAESITCKLKPLKMFLIW
jgi:hypothetical protein